jgi:hypothetical protein
LPLSFSVLGTLPFGTVGLFFGDVMDDACEAGGDGDGFLEVLGSRGALTVAMVC